VPRPAAYVVRRDQESAIRKLREHNLPVERLTAAATLSARSYRITSVRRASSPDVGDTAREESVVEARPETVFAGLEKDDAVVRTDHPLGTLACYLLEPESDDGLARWGYFDGALGEAHVYPVLALENPALAELPATLPY
jgi:hypothetical protein